MKALLFLSLVTTFFTLPGYGAEGTDGPGNAISKTTPLAVTNVYTDQVMTGPISAKAGEIQMRKNLLDQCSKLNGTSEADNIKCFQNTGVSTDAGSDNMYLWKQITVVTCSSTCEIE